MYRDMHPGEEIEIIAIDAATGQRARCRLRVVSIRSLAEGNDALDVTFEYLGDGFTFFAWEGRGLVALAPGTLMEAGISAVLIPQYIQRLVGIGGIGVGRDYCFQHAGGEYGNFAILHGITALGSKYDATAPFEAPNVAAHLASIDHGIAANEQQLVDDLPEVIAIPDAHRRRQLEVKLAEYQDRLDAYQHPQLQATTHAKIAVLTKLLEQGTFQPKVARSTFIDAPWFASDAYFIACSVVNEYCVNGGIHLSGGTGIPDVQ